MSDDRRTMRLKVLKPALDAWHLAAQRSGLSFETWAHNALQSEAERGSEGAAAEEAPTTPEVPAPVRPETAISLDLALFLATGSPSDLAPLLTAATSPSSPATRIPINEGTGLPILDASTVGPQEFSLPPGHPAAALLDFAGAKGFKTSGGSQTQRRDEGPDDEDDDPPFVATPGGVETIMGIHPCRYLVAGIPRHMTSESCSGTCRSPENRDRPCTHPAPTARRCNYFGAR